MAAHTLNEEGRRGADLAFQQMLLLQQDASDAGNCVDRPEDYFAWRHDAAARLVDALGPMPDHLRGAFMAMAEWIHYSETTGTPSELWQPIASMTDDQLRLEIEQMNESLLEDASRNVLPFRR